MLRMLVIAILVAQALVAQAGVPGISCLHTFAHSPQQQAELAKNQTQTAQAPSAKPNKSPTHKRCCCDVMGHCSSSAINTASLFPRTHGHPPSYSVPFVITAITMGFTSPPYRPPSSAA
jgi:hypothetical protein